MSIISMIILVYFFFNIMVDKWGQFNDFKQGSFGKTSNKDKLHQSSIAQRLQRNCTKIVLIKIAAVTKLSREQEGALPLLSNISLWCMSVKTWQNTHIAEHHERQLQLSLTLISSKSCHWLRFITSAASYTLTIPSVEHVAYNIT